jgi:glycosyltransferase involved in cell wall biosynthesis
MNQADQPVQQAQADHPAGSAPLSLRILQFVPEILPTFRADVAALFGKYLPRHGVMCDLVGQSSTNPGPQPGFGRVLRPSFSPSRIKRELDFIKVCVQALLSAKRSDYAAIQVRDMVGIGMLVLLGARLKGIPFIYWLSFTKCEVRIDRARAGLRNGGGLRDRLLLIKGLVEHFFLYKVLLRQAEHVFVQSDAMLDLVAKEGIPRAKMTPVPMGVDMEVLAQRSAPRRLPGWEVGPVLAYLGTLDPMRQITMVVDALVLIRQRYPSARLLLVGDAPVPSDVPVLLEYAAAAGVREAVHVTGWLPPQQAWELLAGADVAVSYFPRGVILDTASPTKVLEYLALGIPSLGNDNPDQQVVMQESQAGWLTPSTPAGLAEAACAVFADPGQAAQRAARGPAYIESRRSYRVLAEMVSARYASVLQRR